MEYNFSEIEQKWQKNWNDTKAYKVSNISSKPKYYVLDMFPYPSGAGLHVGHPLGYIASDIYARYKRLKGFNVLHPMGYDAFGLPAEQYAIEHGIHPAISTENNIKNFRSQLNKIGFCFDWDREVKTCDAKYYKWTQWIFLQLFNSYFNRTAQKAEPIEKLVETFKQEGNINHECPSTDVSLFTSHDWNAYDEKTQQEILMQYRLAFCGYGEVNWCEALGTVLANDEVVNGVSERGGHPVVKKKLRQWYLRITEYADRLLKGLQTVDFSEAMKEMQTNWIGKSTGAEIKFTLTQPLPKGRGAAVVPKYKVADFIQFENAKRNRKEQTEAENILWQALRNNQLDVKFRRQHPIENFIVDFVCLQKRLIIEVDGGYHNIPEQKELDEVRTIELENIGFTVIRFTNEEVIHSTDAVLNKIKKALSAGGEGLGEVVVYTTRPDTIFGVDFMVLAPEHELITNITTPQQKQAVEEYITYVKSRSDRERQAEKKITGCFTGAYAINPFNNKNIPIYISEYVLAGYGTGAIMAVPCGDERDFKFAKHFNIPITNIIGKHFNGEEANATKDAVLENSDFLNGIVMKDAIEIVVNKLVELGIGKRKTNFKMRDAAFSRQRYWGEPFPIVWKNGIAYALNENELPLLLPEVDSYSPGPEGEGPLANIDSWTAQQLETNTMPGYAGSSWYFLRYMDNENENEFASKQATDYWNQVDVYVGGTEHAVGHLLYSRMWTKALHDLGFISFDEPFKKLVNQGMIQGSSRFVYKVQLINILSNKKYSFFISKNRVAEFLQEGDSIKRELIDEIKKQDFDYFLNDREFLGNVGFRFDAYHVDVNIVDGYELNIKSFRQWKPELVESKFILEEDGKYICGSEVEKMSKSKFNTVNPNDLVEKYGADTFRMYEMFLGPVEQSKPWDTKGIEGVHRFLKKLWRLFFDETTGKLKVASSTPLSTSGEGQGGEVELKILHKAIKKIEEDTERFSYNTAVSAFMVCVNELSDVKCNKKEILEPLLIMLTPYAPHITEELWHVLGNTTSILNANYPTFNPQYLVESSKEYPVSINGKLRTNIVIALDASQQQVEQIVLANDVVKKWVEDKPIKKIIFVKNKMINVVV
ncbi:MAG: leucine--tRNA ligase [Bacteroidetes bacterium]|nr:leucine--tRNA ligase [Bacteroidota bacterium]